MKSHQTQKYVISLIRDVKMLLLQVLLLTYILEVPVCHTILIIKYNKVAAHYTRRMREAGYRTINDIFDTFTIRSRQILCDAIIGAKIYTGTNNQQRCKPVKEKMFEGNWLMNDKLIRIMNYQRSASADELNLLLYQAQPVRLSDSWDTRLKVLQCVNMLNVKWYVTFGFINKLMYLFEPSNRQRYSLRMTAIIEPNPLFDLVVTYEQLWNYFAKQWRTRRGVMESICYWNQNSHIRLCSSLFHVLSINGYIEDNIIGVRFSKVQGCKTKRIDHPDNVYSRKPLIFLRVRPCLINEAGVTSLRQFYVSLDPQNRDSVFLLYPGSHEEIVQLIIRVKKIGVLLNPE